MTSKFKPVLLLCLVFFAGITVGVFGTRMVTRHYFSNHGPNPDLWREIIFKELVAELNLSEEQQKPVREIFLDTQRQLQELRSLLGPKFDEIFKKGEERVRQLLTAEQREKYEAYIKEKKLRRRLPGGMGGSSGGPGGSPRQFPDGRQRLGDRDRERMERPPRETNAPPRDEGKAPGNEDK